MNSTKSAGQNSADLLVMIVEYSVKVVEREYSQNVLTVYENIHAQITLPMLQNKVNQGEHECLYNY